MPSWTPASIPWTRFDSALVDDALVDVIGGLALVESRAQLYGDYLLRVLSSRFDAHPSWPKRIERWASEEEQHGVALRRWFSLARPRFDLDAALASYVRSVAYHDQTTTTSVRGSVEQELVCRCVIEALATTLYQALATSTREPTLQVLLRHLAADEARHYRFFFDLLTEERRAQGTHRRSSVMAMLRRLAALEDDQLAQASHFASRPEAPCDATDAKRRLLLPISASYSQTQLTTLARLLGRIVGIDHRGVTSLVALAATAFLRGRDLLLRISTPHPPSIFFRARPLSWPFMVLGSR